MAGINGSINERFSTNEIRIDGCGWFDWLDVVIVGGLEMGCSVGNP